MFFSKKETELGIIYILTIDKILKDQFGVYTVKAVNTKNCRHSMEFIVRQPAEEGDKKDKREERPTLFALTNSSLSKFKSIMDFMQSGKFLM